MDRNLSHYKTITQEEHQETKEWKCFNCGFTTTYNSQIKTTFMKRLEGLKDTRFLHCELEDVSSLVKGFYDYLPSEKRKQYGTCFGLMKPQKGIKTIEKEFKFLTAFGRATDVLNQKKISSTNGFLDLPTVTCCVKLKNSPYTGYIGYSGRWDRGEDITNERLLKALSNVSGTEPWSPVNCGEVQAAQHLLNANPGIQPNEVEFCAVDISGAMKPPCSQCAQWISKF